MAFSQRPRRDAPNPSPRSRTAVYAVGRRVYVASGDGPRRVTLTDDVGKNELGTLADGTEVAILAWRPGGTGTRYRIRATETGIEGWLAVGNLRASAVAVAVSPSLPPQQPSPTAVRANRFDDSPRRFGQR
jgi:hypothetical protein